MASFDTPPSSRFLTSTLSFRPTTADAVATPTTAFTPITTESRATPTSSFPNASTTTAAYGTTSSEQQSNNNHASGLSSSARNAVICTAAIGGTFLLALLIYALWRRCRKRPQPKPNRTAPGLLNGRLTALPIYCHQRFSVSFSRQSVARDRESQSSIAKDFRPETPEQWLPSRPQTAESRKPRHLKGLRRFLNATAQRPSPRKPETPTTVGRSSEDLPVTGHSVHSKTSYHNIKQLNHPSTAPNKPPFDAAHLEAADSLDRPDRWSWTNSQAPATPHLVPPGRLSLSRRSIRSISSWVTSGSKKDEPPKMPSPLPPMPTRQRSRHELLKNQAVQPILAPPPAAKNKSSKQDGSGHGRVGSLSMIFKPNPDSLIPAPTTPMVEEQPRTGTTLGSPEMRQTTT